MSADDEAQPASAATLSGAQNSQRTKDQVVTAAAVVIFWPAAFLVGGDKQNAAELAQMKGQTVANAALVDTACASRASCWHVYD
jgi:hypothetical protein